MWRYKHLGRTRSNETHIFCSAWLLIWKNFVLSMWRLKSAPCLFSLVVTGTFCRGWACLPEARKKIFVGAFPARTCWQGSGYGWHEVEVPCTHPYYHCCCCCCYYCYCYCCCYCYCFSYCYCCYGLLLLLLWISEMLGLFLVRVSCVRVLLSRLGSR